MMFGPETEQTEGTSHYLFLGEFLLNKHPKIVLHCSKYSPLNPRSAILLSMATILGCSDCLEEYASR